MYRAASLSSVFSRCLGDHLKACARFHHLYYLYRLAFTRNSRTLALAHLRLQALESERLHQQTLQLWHDITATRSRLAILSESAQRLLVRRCLIVWRRISKAQSERYGPALSYSFHLYHFHIHLLLCRSSTLQTVPDYTWLSCLGSNPSSASQVYKSFCAVTS